MKITIFDKLNIPGSESFIIAAAPIGNQGGAVLVYHPQSGFYTARLRGGVFAAGEREKAIEIARMGMPLSYSMMKEFFPSLNVPEEKFYR